MRKWTIIIGIAVFGFIGLWVYLYNANLPWISDATKSGTRGIAQSIGIHALDDSNASGDSKKKSETVANLPDGYYVYVGTRPMQATPKWVVVNPDSTIAWLNQNESAAIPARAPQAQAADPNPSSPVKPASAVTSDKPTQGEFESYEYPKIKWKAKPLPSGPNAIAQLHTTYEVGAPGQQGVMKYRLTVFKGDNKGAYEVQLLDSNGFKLMQFNASDFHKVPNSELMESRESIACDENEYRQARDYSVN